MANRVKFCKYGPPVFQELYREALYARLAGKHPTVGIEEWVKQLLPKIPSALAVTEY